jgi:hypothetical protein
MLQHRPTHAARLRSLHPRVDGSAISSARQRFDWCRTTYTTCDGASLDETFRPAEASRILDKIEFHYSIKHGSWLNVAENKINIMGHQCLDR